MSLANPLCLYESVVQQDRPLRWWGLDEASPTADDSGNGGTLTAVGSPGLVAPLLAFDAGGTADGARSFNGTTQSYTAASITMESISSSCRNWSIEFWCRFDTVSGTQTIISTAVNGPQIRRNGTNIEVLTQAAGAGTQVAITVGVTLATATVYHVVVTCSFDWFQFDGYGIVTGDSISGSNTLVIWIDGVSRGSGSSSSFSENVWAPRIGSKTGGSEWFDGDLDEVAIYQYGLAADQVRQHFNAGSAGTWGRQLPNQGYAERCPRFVLEAAVRHTHHWHALNQSFSDLSDLCRSFDFVRGGDNAALNPPRAGTMALELLNTNGEFESGPGNRFQYGFYSGESRSGFEPGRAIRLRLWWPDTATPVFPMWFGYVESIGFQRRPGLNPTISARCSDGLQFVAQAVGNGASHAAELSNSRIADLLTDNTTYADTIPRSFETGNATVAFKVSTGNLLELINEVTFTEGGGSVFFQAAAGAFKFFNSTHRSGLSVSAVYGGYPTVDDGLLSNGHFLTDTSGWTAVGANTIARVLVTPASPDPADAGYALQITCQDSFPLAFTTPTLAANTIYTMSAWVYIPTAWDGGSVSLSDFGQFSDATEKDSTPADMSLRDQWQQIAYTFKTGTDVTASLFVDIPSLSTAGRFIYIDGAAVHPGNGGLPYGGSDPVHDDADVFTFANWKNDGIPITTSQTSAVFVRKHGDKVHTKDTLHTTGALLDAAALAFVNRFKESNVRIPAIFPMPQAAANNPSPAKAWRAFMGHEISDKIIVVDYPEAGLSDVAADLTRYVEGIGMRADQSSVECLLNISPYA